MLSQQESIKQKCLSTVLFPSFSFFFLSFSLTWEKCLSRQTDTCSSVHSINLIVEIEPLQSLFFFWIHITFQYLRIVERKRFELYLSLMGFQCSDSFLFFLWVSDLPRAGWPQRSASDTGFIQTKISSLDFSNGWWSFWREEPVGQSFDFLLPPPRQVTPLDWPRLLSFNSL